MPRVPEPCGRVAVVVTVASFFSGVRYAFPSGLVRSGWLPSDTCVSCGPIVAHVAPEHQPNHHTGLKCHLAAPPPASGVAPWWNAEEGHPVVGVALLEWLSGGVLLSHS